MKPVTSSASNIANGKGGAKNEYDGFPHPQHMPPKLMPPSLARLQDTARAKPDHTLSELEGTIHYIGTVLSRSGNRSVTIPPSSETKVVDPQARALLERMCKMVDREDVTVESKASVREKFKGKFLLCSENSEPEYALMHNGFVLVGAETQGLDASLFKALPQACQLAGDAAALLCRKGLPSDQCCVPALLMAGGQAQLMAAYIIKDSVFPMYVFLTQPLQLADKGSRGVLAQWLHAIVKHVNSLVTAVKGLEGDSKKKDDRLKKDDDDCLMMDFKELFLKPVVVQARGALNNDHAFYPYDQRVATMLEMFGKLACAGADYQQYFNLPRGVFQMPHDSCQSEFAQAARDSLHPMFKGHAETLQPFLVFKRLGGNWTTSKPDIKHVNSYVNSLTKCCDGLNAASIAHLDLHSENVMYCVEGGKMQMKVIDFEDAVAYGQKIDPSIFGDKRYPLYECNETSVTADVTINEWSRDLLIKWVRSEGDETYLKFARDAAFPKWKSTTAPESEEAKQSQLSQSSTHCQQL
jgi:hypothetical protein